MSLITVNNRAGSLQAPIYILGISPRSGTNFLYDLLRLHPGVDCAETVQEDFLLFGAHHLQAYVTHVANRWDMKWGMLPSDSAELFRTLGEAGLQFLRRRQPDPGLRLLTKTPEVANLPVFFDLFPDAQLIIMVRDGRAVVESKMKSFEADFANATKNWALAGQMILDFAADPPSPNFRIIKYEDLYQKTEASLRALLDFLGLDPGVYPFESIDSIPVRGSSLYHGASGRLDWSPVEKTEAFRPLERFSHWTERQHIEFNLIAGNTLERFGYRLEERLYIKANLIFMAHDEEHNLVTRLDTGFRVLMNPGSSTILKGFDRFLSLREHFQRSGLQQEDLDDFLEFCMDCVASGLLCSSEDFADSLLGGERKQLASANIAPVIFIRTCDRTQFLERLLKSLATSCAASELPVYVLDDSRSIDVQRANADVVAGFNIGEGLRVIYLGEQWQLDYLQKLTRVFPAYESLIRYLLQPRPAGLFSAGRLLNLAILLFAGRRLLTYDDDYIVDQAWRHPEASMESLSITDERAYCLEGFDTECELLQTAIGVSLDPVQPHINILGKTLADAIACQDDSVPKAVSLHGLGSSFASQIGPQSRILTTGNGILGKPIAPDATLGWFAASNTIPVWSNKKNYRAWMRGEHIFSSHRKFSIEPMTYGMPVGIDNSQLMPPTIPVGKREDTLFTFLLHRCHDLSVHLEFPWSVAHKRETRDWRKATLETPVLLCLAQVVMVTLDNTLRLADVMGTAEARLMMAGTMLSEKGTQSLGKLRIAVIEVVEKISTLHRQKLMQAWAREDAIDEDLKADLQRALQVSRESQLNQPSLSRLEDTNCPREELEQLQWLQQELTLFGQSLLIWPMLWAYCRDNPVAISMDDQVNDLPPAKPKGLAM